MDVGSAFLQDLLFDPPIPTDGVRRAIDFGTGEEGCDLREAFFYLRVEDCGGDGQGIGIEILEGVKVIMGRGGR